MWLSCMYADEDNNGKLQLLFLLCILSICMTIEQLQHIIGAKHPGFLQMGINMRNINDYYHIERFVWPLKTTYRL